MRGANASQVAFGAIMKMLASLWMTCAAPFASAAEAPTEEVLQECRALLSSEKAAIPANWSTKPLPATYRRVAGLALQGQTVGGWIDHKNPNGTSTIAVYAFDP